MDGQRAGSEGAQGARIAEGAGKPKLSRVGVCMYITGGCVSIVIPQVTHDIHMYIGIPEGVHMQVIYYPHQQQTSPLNHHATDS